MSETGHLVSNQVVSIIIYRQCLKTYVLILINEITFKISSTIMLL